MSIITSINLPEEMNAKLAALAEETGKSGEFHILQALSEYLEDMEDIRRADEVMAGIRAGTVKISPAKEVWERLDLEN